jgi:hypothetical protein
VKRRFTLQGQLVRFSPAIQISLSTAEESANYFTGHGPLVTDNEPVALLPAGTYRVVDDQLFQIVDSPVRLGPPKQLP